MKVGLASFEEVGKKFLRRSIRASLLLFGRSSNKFTNIRLLIGWEDIWNFTCVENIVDILEEAFLLDLSISEEECCWVTFATHLSHQDFNILSPLLGSVNFFDLDLEDIKV